MSKPSTRNEKKITGLWLAYTCIHKICVWWGVAVPEREIQTFDIVISFDKQQMFVQLTVQTLKVINYTYGDRLDTYEPRCTYILIRTYWCIHTHKHTYTQACIHTSIHTDTYIHTSIHTHKHAYTQAYILYIQTYSHTHNHTYIQTHIHTYTQAYIHTIIHMGIHTHIHTHSHTYIQSYKHTYGHTYIHTHKEWNHTVIMAPEEFVKKKTCESELDQNPIVHGLTQNFPQKIKIIERLGDDITARVRIQFVFGRFPKESVVGVICGQTQGRQELLKSYNNI